MKRCLIDDDIADVFLFAVPSLSALERACYTEFVAVLSDEERRQLGRFRFEKDRWRYVVTRVLVRDVLSHITGLERSELTFGRSKYGKPKLVQPAGLAPVEFNVSHTNESIVCVVSRVCKVGIDVELPVAPEEVVRLAEVFLSVKERQALFGVASNNIEERFQQYWIVKEALLKLWGVGLMMPSSGFSVSFRPERTIELEDEKLLDVSHPDDDFGIFKLPGGHLGALALRSKQPNVRVAFVKCIPLASYNFSELCWTENLNCSFATIKS